MSNKPLAAGAALLLLTASLSGTRAQPKGSANEREPPSPVHATYVEPSAERELVPGVKIAQLTSRNQSNPYVLQRLTQRTYWFERQYYATIFYVGEKGVLVFDPLDGRGHFLRQAIAQVTKLPVTTVVYSHHHVSRIGDAKVFVEAAEDDAVKLRIIASRATAEKMEVLGSKLPRPTETVSWPRGSFLFDGLTVELHGFVRAAHTDDHGAWLLIGERVVHVPEQISPDQLPAWSFSQSENFVYYPLNLEQVGKLHWSYLCGGLGNVGSRADLELYRAFATDLRRAVERAMRDVPWGTGLVEGAAVDVHYVYLPAWLEAITTRATDALRPKYGSFYGFDTATPRNAEMVALALFGYR